MNKKKDLTFEGSLARLRPLLVADAELTLRWRLSSRARFLQKGATTIEEQQHWIASALCRERDLNFIIEHRGDPVGTISLLDINDTHKTVMMGRELVGEERLVAGAPVAFEAELLLCDYVFDVLKLHKIYGDVMADNLSMLRTRRYLGYQQDGILRDHYLYDGVHKSTIAFSLLENEYRAYCRPKILQLIDLLTMCSRADKYVATY